MRRYGIFVVCVLLFGGAAVPVYGGQSVFVPRALLPAAVLPVPGQEGSQRHWQRIRGEHFIVYYWNPADRDVAQETLLRAEQYYHDIGAMIGYTRYDNFWTWDQRARIVLFPDKASFLQTTGMPAWSFGYADRDSSMFNSRTIVTYRQEGDFYNGLLPHEITHLILHDYVPQRYLPIWFDEGIAQYNENDGKIAMANRLMRLLVAKGQYVPLNVMMTWDIRHETDTRKVEVFYAESLTIVNFLIKEYGVDAFRELCRQLRGGQPFAAALQAAYTNNLDSIKDLQQQWLEYMKQ